MKIFHSIALLSSLFSVQGDEKLPVSVNNNQICLLFNSKNTAHCIDKRLSGKTNWSFHDVASHNQDFWVVTKDRSLYKWDLKGIDFTSKASNVNAVSIAKTGAVWIVNSFGQPFHQSNGDWVKTDGPISLKDVAAIDENSAWGIGAKGKIWKYDQGRWWISDGGAVRIAVEYRNAPWVVNKAGNIYVKKGSKAGRNGWIHIHCAKFKAQDIAIKHGFVYVTDVNEQIWKSSTADMCIKGFVKVEGTGARIG